MEAFDSPEEKLFARLVEQYPPRTAPVLKIVASFVMFAGAVAGVCLFFWMVMS